MAIHTAVPNISFWQPKQRVDSNYSLSAMRVDKF